jgi:putative glycerol-1-phosphate prenyltransferase
MNKNGVYDSLVETAQKRGAGFFVLVDPDKSDENDYLITCEAAEDCGVDAILVGTSFMLNNNFAASVKKIKSSTSLPVVIFPGSFAQITPDADAILFSSLISGRNPSFLIDEQVKGAPLVKRFGIEPIPTGYMLIESGPLTSVQYISGSMPIPRTKSDIACAHALAAQYLGMKLVYLEAGSGAQQPVPIEMIKAVASYVDIPVITGGGLKTPDDCAARVEAGASFIVVGNHLESGHDRTRLRELTAATHIRESIEV